MKNLAPRFCAAVVLLALAATPAAAEKIKVRLAPMPGMGQLVPQLAVGLGYFEQEGLAPEMVTVMDWVEHDWLSGQLLNDGTIDAEVNWFHRVVYGNGNRQPLRAVVLLEDSPGMKILVARRLADHVHSAAQFPGRRISTAGGYSTKRYLTELVSARHGVPPAELTFLPEEFQQGRSAAQIAADLQAGRGDVIACMDPLTRGLEESGAVATLYDLTTREGTQAALGEIWPARCLFVSPKFIEQHPETVQKLVNTFVRTMRYLNAHSADEIFAKLPLSYFNPHTANNAFRAYKAEEKLKLARARSTFTRGDYSIPPTVAAFATQVTLADDTPEGAFRRAARDGHVRAADTYDNRFVEAAMKAIP
jgi:NitT/TauT family transport system substrate-binding protein